MTLTLYATTAAVFLILDAIMLTLVMKPLFTRHIGPLMAEPIRLAPAAAFYLAYVGGLIYLVSLPAIRSNAPHDHAACSPLADSRPSSGGICGRAPSSVRPQA